MILFVCLGNICRSPMAEFVMKDLLQKEGVEMKVMSAGLIDDHKGEDMHRGTRSKLQSVGIIPQGFQSKLLTQELCQQARLIVAMDRSNHQSILMRFYDCDSKLSLLTDFIPEMGYKEVPDPWYSRNFDETYELVLAGSKAILQNLRISSSKQ